MDATLALDLGATKLAAAWFGPDGIPRDQQVFAIPAQGGAAAGALATHEVLRLANAAQRRGDALQAVGVCVPGVVDGTTGRVWAPNIQDWEDYPLREEIRTAVADDNVDVVVDNDRAASILGEAWQGAARGLQNAIFLAVGTGIGAGILVDGRVVHGAHGIAGAVGWWALNREFRDEYAACGCFESHASGDGLAKVSKDLLARDKLYAGPLRDCPALSARDVFDAYERGDPLADKVLQQAVRFWGMAAANLVSLFNPEMIVFGGGVFGPATRFLDAIAAEARRWAQPLAMERVRLAPSQLGPDAALYGAAYLARHGRAAPRTLSP